MNRSLNQTSIHYETNLVNQSFTISCTQPSSKICTHVIPLSCVCPLWEISGSVTNLEQIAHNTNDHIQVIVRTWVNPTHVYTNIITYGRCSINLINNKTVGFIGRSENSLHLSWWFYFVSKYFGASFITVQILMCTFIGNPTFQKKCTIHQGTVHTLVELWIRTEGLAHARTWGHTFEALPTMPCAFFCITAFFEEVGTQVRQIFGA